MKNGKIANINVSIKRMFKKWLELTKPFHGLTKQEINILSLLLYYNHIYKKDIVNETIRWKYVFDYDTRVKIKEELNIKSESFENALSRLRQKNVIKNGQITSLFIPELAQNSKIFRIIFNLNIVDNG